MNIPNKYLYNSTNNLRNLPTYSSLTSSKKKEEKKLPVKIKDNGNLFSRFFTKIIFFFSKKRNSEEFELNDELLRKKIDDNNKRIISESENKLKKLFYYRNTFKDVPLLYDVYDYTKMFHDVVLQNKLKLQLIEQFHMYYTDHFIELFEKIIDNNRIRVSLIEKKKEKLKNDIINLEKDKKIENDKIKSVDIIKNESIRYEKMVINQILKDIDQKTSFGTK